MVILVIGMVIFIGSLFWINSRINKFEIITEFLKSDDTKEVYRKTDLIMNNTKTVQQVNNGKFLIETLIENYANEYKFFNKHVSEDVIEFMFIQLRTNINIMILERELYLLEREKNKNLI